MAAGLVLSAQTAAAFTAGEAAELDASAKATLEQFKAEAKGSDEVFANAKGVLVCPKIVKAGVALGAEAGKCVLTSGSSDPVYYQSTALKGGLIIGVEWHSMILVINTAEALAKFTSDKREWELGVDASIAIAEIGAGGDLDTTNLKKDIVSFIFGQKGLMADVSWEGSRFKKLDIE
jgi:lipid-binding SYLF domain-containing protein